MKYFEALYEKEVKEPILDYEKLVNKYLALLTCFFEEKLSVYQNMTYLKNVVIGFNHYHLKFLGSTYLPNDYIYLSCELWENITNKENLSTLDQLFLLTVKTIANILSQNTNKNNLYLSKDLLINFYSVYNTLTNTENYTLS